MPPRAIVLEANQAQPIQLDLEQRFSLFVGTHRERARRLAWRLVGGDDGAAEDVTQDAFVKAYQGLSTFREEASLETWFYRILVRQAHNYRRWRSVLGGDGFSPSRSVCLSYRHILER